MKFEKFLRTPFLQTLLLAASEQCQKLDLASAGKYLTHFITLIYSANQWAGFYVIGISVMKELISNANQFPNIRQ